REKTLELGRAVLLGARNDVGLPDHRLGRAALRHGGGHRVSTSFFSSSVIGALEKRVILARSSSSMMSTMLWKLASLSILITTTSLSSAVWCDLMTGGSCASVRPDGLPLSSPMFQNILSPPPVAPAPSTLMNRIWFWAMGIWMSLGGRLISSAWGVRNTVVT